METPIGPGATRAAAGTSIGAEEAVRRLIAGAAVAHTQGWSGMAHTFTDLASVLQALPHDSALPIAAALLGDNSITTTEEGNRVRTDA